MVHRDSWEDDTYFDYHRHLSSSAGAPLASSTK
jgi:hypothetical protein